ncbi:MAG TPA: hypothetical protein VL094_01740 [Sphingomonadaceae bacterium]|nr:hypothetical protein [Sphingomonadaceae bacterium]
MAITSRVTGRPISPVMMNTICQSRTVPMSGTSITGVSAKSRIRKAPSNSDRAPPPCNPTL